jgi:hypothetical protein
MAKNVSLLFVIIFYFSFGNLNAQGISFQKTIGGNSFDFGIDLVELSNKDYCILSSSSSYSTSNDMLVWVIDSIGDYKHHFLIGQNDVESSSSIRSKNDTLFILGNSLNPGSGNYDILFSSFTSSGTLLFEKRFDYAIWEMATSLAFTADRGFLICGNTNVDEFNQTDGFLLKLDEMGEVVFYRNYGNSGIDSLGGVVEAGDSYFTIGTYSNPVTNDKDIWVLKLDSANGNILNEEMLGGNFDDFGQSIMVNSLGAIILGGVTNSFFNPGITYNYFFQMVDQNLNSLWSTPQTSNNTFDWISVRSMDLLPNDEILFFGTKSTFGIKDFMVYQLNSQGYFNGGTSFGTFGNEFGGKLVYTSDSGFIFCGTTNGYWPGLDNIYVQKNNSNFVFNPPPVFEVGIDQTENFDSEISVFPNPATSQISIKGDFSSFEIMNSLGQIILNDPYFNKRNISGTEMTIDLRGISSGIYFLRFINATLGKESIQKFVVLDR